MTSLHLELQCCAPALGSFLSWCILFYGSDVSFPTPIAGLFDALGKASPMCALLSQLDSLETFYHRLIGNKPVKQCPEDMLLLQQTFPLLYEIVSINCGERSVSWGLDCIYYWSVGKSKVRNSFSRNGSIPDAVQLDVHRNCNWMCAVLCNWMCAEMM